MNIHRIMKYCYLIRTFRNGPSLVWAYRHNEPIGDAIFYNGNRMIHPANQVGLAGTLLELWYDECYTNDGFYSPTDQDVIFDVGAHIGLFSFWVARRNRHCRIFALEPEPENWNCLQNNIHSLGYPNVQGYFMALGREYGTGFMTTPTTRSIDYRLVSDRQRMEQHVSIVPLQELFQLAQCEFIDFLKMDVEGSERDVFENASQELLGRCKRIALEYHDHIRPGTLDLIRNKLETTHDLVIEPIETRGYGLLKAKLRSE